MNRPMQLTAGIHSPEGYLRLTEAGADECFLGVVPPAWDKTYGTLLPANRREVRYYNVQIGAISELVLLRRMVEEVGAPVTVVFNALTYLPEQYPVIAQLVRQLMDLGFDRFIVADLGLLLYLRDQGLSCRIHLSGEWGELNTPTMALLEPLHIARYIFHRKMTPFAMARCIKQGQPGQEFEAFLLNERCQFSGGYCHCLHCDALPPLCQVPYDLGRLRADSPLPPELSEAPDFQGIGDTGCGLCALPWLREIGVTHLKIVGRGKALDEMAADVRTAKAALALLETVPESAFSRHVKALLGGKCSGQCYYLQST